MALSRGQKIAIGVGAVAALGLAAAAAADDTPPKRDVPDPPDEPVVPPPDPVEPPPPKPPAGLKNYVGSGYAWPYRNEFPSEASFGYALQEFGYDTRPWSAGWSVIGQRMMTMVREFQRDYNSTNPPKKLADDGLIGKNTIDAIRNAKAWTLAEGISWPTYIGAA